MPQTFPDGFPMTPDEAIQFSYFFTDDEKKEWLEWLQTSSPDEKSELVEMLHKIWLDKQKQVIPDQFNNGYNANYGQAAAIDQAIQPAANLNSAPANDFYAQQLSSPATEPVTNSTTSDSEPAFNFEDSTPSFADPFSNHASQLETPVQIPSAVSPFSFDEQSPAPADPTPSPDPSPPTPVPQEAPAKEESLLENLGSNNFNPNPILNDPKPDPADYGFVMENKSLEDFQLEDEPSEAQPEPKNQVNSNSNNQNIRNKSKPKVNQNQTNRNSQDRADGSNQQDNSKPIFSVAKVREAGTRVELENLYQDYLETRGKIQNNQQQHNTSYDALLQKMISIVLTFENVADYLESMTSKLVEMNDLIVKQSQQMATFRVSQNDGLHNVETKIEELSNDFDRFKKTSSSNTFQLRHRLDEVEVQLSGLGMNTYGDQDGLWTQIELLKGKLIKMQNELETKVSNSSDQSSSANQPRNLQNLKDNMGGRYSNNRKDEVSIPVMNKASQVSTGPARVPAPIEKRSAAINDKSSSIPHKKFF